MAQPLVRVVVMLSHEQQVVATVVLLSLGNTAAEVANVLGLAGRGHPSCNL